MAFTGGLFAANSEEDEGGGGGEGAAAVHPDGRHDSHGASGGRWAAGREGERR